MTSWPGKDLAVDQGMGEVRCRSSMGEVSGALYTGKATTGARGSREAMAC